MRYLLTGAVLCGVIAGPTQANQVAELEPASNWVLNYDDDSCSLHREFGEDGERVSLEMRQFGPETSLQILVASQDLRQRRGDFHVRFLPVEDEAQDHERFDMEFTNGASGKMFTYPLDLAGKEMDAAFESFVEDTPLLTELERSVVLQGQAMETGSRQYERLGRRNEYQTGWRQAQSAFRKTDQFRQLRDGREGAITSLLLERAWTRPVSLKIGSLHAPMEAMRSCLDELETHWGIDVEAHKNLKRQALPVDWENWSSRVRRGYPLSMLQQGYQGHVRTRLGISPDGDVTDCHVQSSISNEVFRRTACRGLSQGKFTPALDAQGRPIASYYLLSVVYSFD